MFGLGVIDLELNHPFFYFVYDQQTKTVLFAGRLSSVESQPAGTFGSGNQPENAVPLGLPAASTQPASHATTPVPSGQQYPASTPRTANRQSYAGAAGSNVQSYPASPNSYGSSNQQPYAAPTSGFGSGTQQSYAAPGYHPEAPMAAPRPGSGVENHSSGSKPTNLGTRNHQFNRQAPTTTAPKRYQYGDLEYPVSRDSRNHANEGYNPYRA